MRLLLIEPDVHRLRQLSVALRASGLDVQAVTRIADIERWPKGRLIVAAGEYFGGWCSTVGASGTIVLADSPEEALCAQSNGAVACLARGCDPGELVALLHTLSTMPPPVIDPACAGRYGERYS